MADLRLCFAPHDDQAFCTAIQIPPRASFLASGGNEGAGLAYLRAVRAAMPSCGSSGGAGDASASGGAGSPRSVQGLLAAALAAAGRSFPSVSDGVDYAQGTRACGASGTKASTTRSLTRSQIASLNDFLRLVHETRERSLTTPPAQLLQWLCRRVSLDDWLDKVRKTQRAKHRAYRVHVPGAAVTTASGVSDGGGDDDDDDGDDDESTDEGEPAAWPSSAKRTSSVAFGHAPPEPPSRHASAAIANLLRSAQRAGERVDQRAAANDRGSPQPSRSSINAALSRFCDSLLMATHDEDAGRGVGQTVLVTTIHQ